MLYTFNFKTSNLQTKFGEIHFKKINSSNDSYIECDYNNAVNLIPVKI